MSLAVELIFTRKITKALGLGMMYKEELLFYWVHRNRLIHELIHPHHLHPIAVGL